MQIPKDEVKNNIIDAAIEEFLVSGYENSSMRVIATNAGITVGNIYSYFNGKEDLFETIVFPTVMKIKGLILMKLSTDNSITPASAMEVTRQIMNAFLNNRQEFLILMNNAKGSKYENIKSAIQMQIMERLIVDLVPKLPARAENEILADTLSLVLLDGIINIVMKSENDKHLMSKLICEFLLLVFGNIEERL
ncbi:MAG: TetR/AcrR family transcriptional regulator [Oscillospiraceae bacterium]